MIFIVFDVQFTQDNHEFSMIFKEISCYSMSEYPWYFMGLCHEIDSCKFHVLHETFMYVKPMKAFTFHGNKLFMDRETFIKTPGI